MSDEVQVKEGPFNRAMLEHCLKWARTEREQALEKVKAGEAEVYSEWEQFSWADGLLLGDYLGLRPVGALSLQDNPSLDEWVHKVEWVQARTGCDTSFCLAGHATITAGDAFVVDPMNSPHRGTFVLTEEGIVEQCGSRARDLMGITIEEANELFNGSNTWEDCLRIAEEICAAHGEVLSV